MLAGARYPFATAIAFRPEIFCVRRTWQPGRATMAQDAGSEEPGAQVPSGSALEGLAKSWDETPEIRQALRSGKALIQDVSDKAMDMKVCVTYPKVLTPVLEIMAATPEKKIPSIDCLRLEVARLLEFNKRQPGIDEVDKYSWLVRKYCGFIKMKCRKKHVSVAPNLNFFS